MTTRHKPRPIFAPQVEVARDASIRGTGFGVWFEVTDQELRAAGITPGQVVTAITALIRHYLGEPWSQMEYSVPKVLT